MRQPIPQQPRAGGSKSSFAKMKPYEKLLLIVGVSLLLIAGFLFQGYRQAQASKEKASKRLTSVERNLNVLRKDFDIEALEKKKADITQELSEPDAPWNKNFTSLDIDNLVTSAAVQNKVEVVRLALGKGSRKKIAVVEYQVELRQIEVKGDLPNIVRFIDQIERGRFLSLRLDNITMNFAKNIWNAKLDIELWYLVEPGGSDAGRKG